MYEAICVVRPNARVRNALGDMLTAVALEVLVISSNGQAQIEALEPPFKAAVCVGGGQTSHGDASGSLCRCRPSDAAVCGLRV